MGTIKAKGGLRHRFHGEYSAVVGFVFEDWAAATQAQAIFCGVAGKWVPATKPNALVWIGDSTELDSLKAELAKHKLVIPPCGSRHCKSQCKDAEIDSVNHSIDYGPAFTLEIEVVASEQLSLLGAP